MGRKIIGKRHKGVKHPEQQAARRLERIADKINCPPRSTNTQEVPRSFSVIKKFMDAQKNEKKKTLNENETRDSTEVKSVEAGQPSIGSKKQRKWIHPLRKLSEKRAAKRDARIKAKLLKRQDAKDDVERENIGFGEVAHEPPKITYKIKSKTPLNSLMAKPGRKNLLLKSKLKDRKNETEMEEERERVVEMYKVLKQRKRMEISLKK